jgi:Ca-activated chloride channel family protein
MIRLVNPWLLLLLPLVPAVYLLQDWIHRRARSTLAFPDLGLVRAVAVAPRLRHLSVAMRLAVLGLAVLALTRPQAGATEEVVLTEGVDIVMAIDVSGSMAAEDFQPRNRLHVAKQVVADFIDGRRHDRIGLVMFAEHSYTKCPLTLDYDILRTLLDDVRLARRGEDGTAIGMGLATAVNRLRDSEVQSRVIILLTDGRNNRGQIDPRTAADIATSLGIRVHTIGVGTEGMAPFPVEDRALGRRHVYLPVELDEATLREIAERTEGIYFRATDTDSLATIFRRIDAMEKTDIEARQFVRYSELFPWLLFPAGLLLGTDVLLRQTFLRRIP